MNFLQCILNKLSFLPLITIVFVNATVENEVLQLQIKNKFESRKNVTFKKYETVIVVVTVILGE